jgi:hypothetical protein
MRTDRGREYNGFTIKGAVVSRALQQRCVFPALTGESVEGWISER